MITEQNIFEQATRLGLTFEYKGAVGVEDLWNLSLDALNSIYKSLKKSVREDEDGLLDTRTTKADKELDLKIQVVKHVFDALKQEETERKDAVAKRKKKEQLMGVLERKQNQELETMTAEQIKQLIDDLG